MERPITTRLHYERFNNAHYSKVLIARNSENINKEEERCSFDNDKMRFVGTPHAPQGKQHT